MGSGVVIRTGRFPIQNPLDARLGLGTQLRYEVPGDLWVEHVKTQWLTSGEWGCPLNNGLKLGVGQPNRNQKESSYLNNYWKSFFDSLSSIDNPKLYVNQRLVQERFNLILTWYKTKISAEIRARGIEVKEQTPTENLLEELDEKIKKAEADFEAKTLEQSQKAEKEKVVIEDIRKKVLETLAETKKRKQQEGEVKRTT